MRYYREVLTQYQFKFYALNQAINIAEATDENTLRQRFEREGLRVNEKSLGGNTLAVLPSRLDNV